MLWFHAQCRLDTRLHAVHWYGRFEAVDDVALAVDEKLGEVPFHVCALIVVRVFLPKGFVEIFTHLRRRVETLEGFFLLEIGVERQGGLAIDHHLLKLGEGDTIVGRAETMDGLVVAWGLVAKLVAGEVENLESLGMILLIEALQVGVLRCEATAGGGVDNEQHAAFVLLQFDLLALAVLDHKLIDILLGG